MEHKICESTSVEITNREGWGEMELKNGDDDKNWKEYPKLCPRKTKNQHITL